MPNLNEEILKLKGEGLSLRQIAVAFGISHEAVRKRLKNLEGKGNVSTIETERKLTASTIENGKVSTAPNAHHSRASEESESIVNQIPSVESPSHTLTEGVNPLETLSEMVSECKKEAFQGVFTEVGDLFEAIKEFLELNGIEVYRRQSVPECYQVKHRDQVIRFYVQRKQGGTS